MIAHINLAALTLSALQSLRAIVASEAMTKPEHADALAAIESEIESRA